MTLEGKRFESPQDITVVTTVQLNTQKRTCRTALESSKNDGISAFEVEVSILKEINGHVSPTVINFLKILNINCIINHIFQSHHVLQWAFSYQHRLLECKSSCPN